MIKEQTRVDVWLDALRNGEYEQGMECLNDGVGMCCLGVLADVSGETFIYSPSAEIYGVQNEVGELNIALLPTKLAREYNLDKRVTDEEFIYLRNHLMLERIFGSEETVSRMMALSHMNDFGMTFREIADAVEELGWDKID